MLQKKHIVFILFLLICFVTSFTTAYAADEKKVVIPSTTTCAGQALQLNGFGTRKKLFIKLYVASLYVQEKQSDANQILEMKQAACMRLNIVSSKITAKKMVKATREGFAKSTKGNTDPIKSEIDSFLTWLGQPIKKGDVFEFAFIPPHTMHVMKNDSELGTIESQAFSTALMGIWLGEMPADEKLKTGLLGTLHTIQ